MATGRLIVFLLLTAGLASSACTTCKATLEVGNCKTQRAFLEVALDPEPEKSYANLVDEEYSKTEEATFYFFPEYTEDGTFDPITVRIDVCLLMDGVDGCASETIMVFDNLKIKRIEVVDHGADGSFEEATFYRPDGSVEEVFTDENGDGWFERDGCLSDYMVGGEDPSDAQDR